MVASPFMNSIRKSLSPATAAWLASAIVRTLLAQGVSQDHILTRTHDELDLRDQAAVQAFFAGNAPARCIWRRHGWVAFMPTTPTRLTSSTRT